MTAWFMRLAFAIALAAIPSALNAQSPAKMGQLTIEEIVKLSQTGFSDELIIAKVKKNAKAFDLSADELIELRKAGVSENVVRYLLDPSQPYAPPPPAAPPPAPVAAKEKPSAPAKEYPADKFAAQVPPEPGLYHFPKEALLKIDVKVLLGAKEGAGVGKVLLKKGKVLGYLAGPAAKLQIPGRSPSFYMRLAEGKGMEDIVLIALDRKEDRRELDLGPPGPKQELKADAIRPFDSVEVGPRLYKITVPKLANGEYLFFTMGSAEPPKGSEGKGYDFGVSAPHMSQK